MEIHEKPKKVEIAGLDKKLFDTLGAYFHLDDQFRNNDPALGGGTGAAPLAAANRSEPAEKQR